MTEHRCTPLTVEESGFKRERRSSLLRVSSLRLFGTLVAQEGSLHWPFYTRSPLNSRGTTPTRPPHSQKREKDRPGRVAGELYEDLTHWFDKPPMKESSCSGLETFLRRSYCSFVSPERVWSERGCPVERTPGRDDACTRKF